MNNKRTVTLQPHSVGDLLTEVTRTHLHNGLPSTLLKRIKDGVDQFRNEETDSDAKALATYLSGELSAIITRWQEKEAACYQTFGY